MEFPDKLEQALKFAAGKDYSHGALTDPRHRPELDPSLVSAAINGNVGGKSDLAVIGALGDHIQDFGHPLGELLSRFATEGKPSAKWSSLSGDALHAVRATDGHRIIARKGTDKAGKPLTWVSMLTPDYDATKGPAYNKKHKFDFSIYDK